MWLFSASCFCNESCSNSLLRSHSKSIFSSSTAHVSCAPPSSESCFCLLRCRRWWETCSGCGAKTAALSVWSSPSLRASSPSWRLHSGNTQISNLIVCYFIEWLTSWRCSPPSPSPESMVSLLCVWTAPWAKRGGLRSFRSFRALQQRALPSCFCHSRLEGWGLTWRLPLTFS